MQPRVRMILGTVCILVCGIASMLGLTLAFLHPPLVGEHAAGQSQNLQRERRFVDNLHEFRPGNASPGVQTGSPTFVSKYKNYTNATITTDTSICSSVGIEIMRDKGGSVVDAAIATSLCVGIVNSQHCGIGGGHFATIYERPSGKSEKIMVSLIARTSAPASASQNMFVNNTGASTIGGLAVGIPGEVSGYYEAWKMFGRLLWSDLFQPAIRICDEGFHIENSLAKAINGSKTYIYNDTNLRELFVNPNGSLYQEGDLLKNPKLASTLRSIAADPFTFYNGSLAIDIVNDLREYGSNITLEDLQNYRSPTKTPVNVSLHNGQFKLFNPPPPSSGSVLDFIVNILDGYNFSSASVVDTNSTVLTYHRIIEAFKFAYAKRSQLGDEDFVNVKNIVANLTSDEYAEEIRLQIDDSKTHDVNYYGPTFDVKPQAGTAHLNILASDGAAVSITSSLNLYFGSKCRGRRTGIIFNNDMDDFSTPGTRNYFGVPASPSNYIVPGKRPMSSMSPTIVLDENGSTVFVSGGSGGTIITTATAFVAMNSLWFETNLGNATDTARVHHQLIPNEVNAELWLEQEIVNGLRAKNHTVIGSSNFAVVGSIRNRCPSVSSRDITCIEAVSDGRKGGSPDGYANQTETSTTLATMATTTSLKPISAANSVRCIGVSWLICSAGLLIRVHS